MTFDVESTRSLQQRFHEIVHARSQSILCLRRHMAMLFFLAQNDLVFSSFILPSDTSVFTSKVRGKVVNLPRQFIFGQQRFSLPKVLVNHTMATSGSGVLDGILSAISGSQPSQIRRI